MAEFIFPFFSTVLLVLFCLSCFFVVAVFVVSFGLFHFFLSTTLSFKFIPVRKSYPQKLIAFKLGLG